MTFEYLVIANSNPDVFAQTVADKVNQGWILQGGVSVAVYEPSSNRDDQVVTFAQALTKVSV